RLLIGGDFSTIDGVTRLGVARLLPDGGLDPTFVPNVDYPAVVLALAAQADGKVLVGGVFPSVGGVARKSFARLNYDGSLDMAFDTGPGADGEVQSLAVSDDGTIAIGGNFTRFNRVSRPYLALVNGGPFSAPVIDLQ